MQLHLYVVHMKKVTASEARRNWFRLLDEVVSGERVVIERHGARVVLAREEGEAPVRPDYRPLLQVQELDRAHEWGWRWKGEEGEVVPEEEE